MIERYDYTPAALYARVSSDRQDVDLSVAAQLRALRDYAEKNGYLVVGEFVDEAESGRIADRPQFRKMIDEASRTIAPFKEILVWKFSRFTRKREHAVAFKSMLRRKGVRVVSITEHADDTPTGKLMEAIIESVDEFYSENLARRSPGYAGSLLTRLLDLQPRSLRLQPGHGAGRSQEAPHLGDQPGHVPHSEAHVRHGGGRKRDSRNHPHPQQRGHRQSQGKLWARTSVHNILTNEAYTGTLVWGANAKDNADPVRVEKAFPAIITRAQLQRVGKHLSSRAPKFSHPRRVGSSYLLSGLAKCKTCNTPLIGRFAQSGKYSYYVCQSNIKLGRDACETPTLNARRFEELVVAKIRSNILTKGNIRDLVKVVAEEMDGVTREQRKRLETIEDELEEVKRKLGRIWHFIETSDAVMADASDRIREHRERQERLEYFAEQARAVLAQRRKVLDDVNAIAAYARDMKDFLKESELTERRAFIQSFIKEIVVVPGDALLRYTVPMPDDSLIPGRAAEKVALNGSILSTLPDGGPNKTELSLSQKDICRRVRSDTEI